MTAELDSAGPGIRDALSACGRGELAPNVALMRIIMAAGSEMDVEDALRTAIAAAQHPAKQRLQSALVLWRQTPKAFATVKSVLRTAEPGGTGVADWKRAFDQSAGLSPEASVALYSLGRRDLLDAASGEIIQHLKEWNVLSAATRVLEIGCGIGRLIPALAREADFVIGLDISPAMLHEAAPNCPGTNAMLIRGSGVDLAPFRDEAFDLVLAIDSFPYIVAAGRHSAATHIAEAARVLKSGGALVIVNYSYRGNDELDRRDITRSARDNGLTMGLNGRRDFALWDGLIFRLCKSGRDRNGNSRQRVG
jgi:SAM-dependent methyltransferase